MRVKFQGTIKEIGLQQGTVLHPVKFQGTKKEIGLQQGTVLLSYKDLKRR